MTTAILDAKTTEFDVDDVEYLRHGDKPLLARVFKPRGAGPFPALVECHGGAWCMSDRTTEQLRHESMASHGIVSIALDFRSGNEDPYPASVQDINYAVRWAKLNARELKTRPELVGLSGQSSGGHLAMLVAMRPHDPRYAAIALPAGSPRARCERALRGDVVAGDQSAQPLPPRQARRRRAPIRRNGRNRSSPRQDSYWRSEANMAEGNPMLALERGEKVLTPPAIWFQGRGDMLHDYKDAESTFAGNEPQRFCRQLPQGRRRDRARIYRHGAPRRPLAGSVEDRRHVRADGGVRGEARQGLSKNRGAAATVARRGRQAT